MEYKDLQRSRALNFGQFIVTDNAARARIQGAEFDGALRFGRDFDLTLSTGYNDAKYQRYEGAQITLDDGSNAIADLSGARLLFAPNFTSALGARYQFGLLQYRSPFQTGDGPASIFRVGSQTNVNLFTTLVLDDSGIKINARVKNLSNKRYYLGPNQSADGTDYTVLSEPRTVTVDVRWDF
jgi:outer membrane receptor protein involved in Fe transport